MCKDNGGWILVVWVVGMFGDFLFISFFWVNEDVVSFWDVVDIIKIIFMKNFGWFFVLNWVICMCYSGFCSDCVIFIYNRGLIFI